jgi:hypothetical protein
MFQIEWHPVMITLSLTALFLGANLACTASRFSRHVATIEQCGGILLIAGFVLLGACLPRMC